MDKKTLLKLVQDKIDEQSDRILERREYLRMIRKQNLPQIDPYRCDEKEYWNMLIRRFNPNIDEDELIREHKGKKYSLENYRHLIEGYCNEDNISAFGLPSNIFFIINGET
jgi:hypothetical protein